MADYPAKKTYRGKGQWEKEAIRNGSPPALELHQRVYVPALQKFGKIEEFDLRIIDPPVWEYRVGRHWFHVTELEIA